ncbi:MAG: hypothetical protein LBB52_00055 [Desulfovibrio sp.]|jgi:hypothetical protein|nr:hypothetical protein [Desulfovibrio sp.]
MVSGLSPDVAFVESFLKTPEEENYLSARVGESDDDTEYRGGFWKNPRSPEIPFVDAFPPRFRGVAHAGHCALRDTVF